MLPERPIASRPARDWDTLTRRHLAFWSCAETDRPLIVALYHAYQDTELVAAMVGPGELTPERIDPRPLLHIYDEMAAAREAICDDMIAPGEPLLGIPWLEAICGCRVLVPEGKSLWPEATDATARAQEIHFDADNPWFRRLLAVQAVVVEHAGGRYPVSMSHLRGPTDILSAMLGSQPFLTALMDEPERVARLANDAAQVWLRVAQAQEAVVPAYRGGYAIRQFGLWSPGRSVWLQDDTSGMMSLRHYRRTFLEPMTAMSVYPFGVLHLHAPSRHVAETLADVPNIRAINVYFDAPGVTLQAAMPILRRLQAKKMPLILAKDVYAGFSLEEYREILDGLSPAGLSVHLKAESVAEGREVMAAIRRHS